MKSQVKIFITAITAAITMQFFAMPAIAGDLQPPSGPDDATSAMYTLGDIYNRLATGDNGSKRTGGFVEPLELNATGYTLDDVMSRMPKENQNGATLADVPCGKFFWSLDNESWGLQEGKLGATTWYRDADSDNCSDGYILYQCDQPVGYYLASDLKATSGDCDDTNADIHPFAFEICGNGVDDDCDNNTNNGPTWYRDDDGDGYGDPNNAIEACIQPSEYVANSDDCDDTDGSRYPGNTEIICNGVDEDCNEDDEKITWYADVDGDTYGDPTTSRDACVQPTDYVEDNTDCNDDNSAVNPGQQELCDNGLDDNCNPGDCNQRIILYDSGITTKGGHLGGINRAGNICSTSANRPEGLGEMKVAAFIGYRDRPIINLMFELNIDMSVPIEGGCIQMPPPFGLFCPFIIAQSWNHLWVYGPQVPLGIIMRSDNNIWWSGANGDGNNATYEQKQDDLCTNHLIPYRHKDTFDADCESWQAQSCDTEETCRVVISPNCTKHGAYMDGSYKIKGRVGSTMVIDDDWISKSNDMCNETAGLLCVAVGERH